MTTGYAYSLQDMKYDVAKWLKEDLIRGMMLCVTLREEGHLTQQEILNKLLPEDNFYIKRINEIEESLKRYKDSSLIQEIEKEYLELIEEENIEREKRIKKWYEEKAAYEKALSEIEFLILKANDIEDSNILGTLSFAKKQLEETLSFSYVRCHSEEVKDNKVLSVSEYVIYKINNLNKDLNYYKKQLEEDKARNQQRHDIYLKFVSFIDENMK